MRRTVGLRRVLGVERVLGVRRVLGVQRMLGCLILVTLVTASSAVQAEGLNNLLAGINGVATAPAEPVMQAIDPPDSLRELPGGVVVAHPLGLVSGSLRFFYQTLMGVLDIALTPLWVIPTLSAEPRWQMFSDLEYE